MGKRNMARRATEESLKVRALAKAYGYTERWARKQRERKTEIWRDWCAGHSVEPVDGVSELGSVGDESDLSRAETVCAEAWVAWEGMNALLRRAMADPAQQDVIPAIARAVRESRKAWEDATRHREALMKSAGVWVPVEKVMAIRSELKPLGGVLEKLEVSIAARLAPEHRHEFYRAFEASLPEWNEGITKMNGYIERLIPSC